MKSFREKRYESFSGPEKAFEVYKTGVVTLAAIGKKVSVSRTSVMNDFIAEFGVEACNNAREEIQRVANIKRRLYAIQEGNSGQLALQEFESLVQDGKIHVKKDFSLETILEIAKKGIGSPKRLWIGNHRVSKIEGSNGLAIVRYSKPEKHTYEYKIKRSRFKITPKTYEDVKIGIFSVQAEGQISYYALPASEIKAVKSLNLKFAEHDKQPFKYRAYLRKIEKQT